MSTVRCSALKTIKMSNTRSTDRSVLSVTLTGFGGYDKIKVQQMPLIPATCQEQDVEVGVKYCAINFADLYLRQGLIPHIKVPHILGLECVGIVQNVGSQVENLKPGDRVLCYRGDGGLYRETVILNQKYCFQIPDYMEDRIAVTLPANYLTAYFCLFEMGNLQPGHRVLIHSCGGGVGWAATQLAKTVKDVIVIGTASPLKHTEVKNNGVDYVIPSKSYEKAIEADTDLNGHKFDIIIDSIGGSNIVVSKSLLNTCGKVIIIGANHIMTSDQKLSSIQLLKSWWSTKPVPVIDLVVNNCAVAGLHLTNLMENSPAKVRDAINYIFQLFKEGKIKPRIDSEYSISEATGGMKKLANRENIGKVIIKV